MKNRKLDCIEEYRWKSMARVEYRRQIMATRITKSMPSSITKAIATSITNSIAMLQGCFESASLDVAVE